MSESVPDSEAHRAQPKETETSRMKIPSFLIIITVVKNFEKKFVEPGDEKVMGEVANQHAEVVGVIERQSAKVENAEEDVSGHGGD